jgi:hypothetical protein
MLPPELLFEVAEFLKPEDVLRLASSCSSFYYAFVNHLDWFVAKYFVKILKEEFRDCLVCDLGFSCNFSNECQLRFERCPYLSIGLPLNLRSKWTATLVFKPFLKPTELTYIKSINQFRVTATQFPISEHWYSENLEKCYEQLQQNQNSRFDWNIIPYRYFRMYGLVMSILYSACDAYRMKHFGGDRPWPDSMFHDNFDPQNLPETNIREKNLFIQINQIF